MVGGYDYRQAPAPSYHLLPQLLLLPPVLPLMSSAVLRLSACYSHLHDDCCAACPPVGPCPALLNCSGSSNLPGLNQPTLLPLTSVPALLACAAAAAATFLR